MIQAIISDANILIDYLMTREAILKMAAKHLFDVYVPTPIFDEVDELTKKKARDLGLKIIEPSLSQLTEAGERRAGLSAQDHLCFIMARDKKWTCATNDKKLQKYCKEQHVDSLWGLAIMLNLMMNNRLTEESAVSTARHIAAKNPRITQKVLTDFERKAKAISAKKPSR